MSVPGNYGKCDCGQRLYLPTDKDVCGNCARREACASVDNGAGGPDGEEAS